ncbi:MAG: asparagine synthase (glutamine-hydrolyzing) [Oscillospiraceae bacterium]|jgi:asparagine synthase (glutamine-hydrolysing)|nr:asparagine synthase (glutamine-hydrolyzing) [Oscillospiraceae bacterium]
MCGFVGFLNASPDEAANGEVIREMAQKIAHRGPDQEDFYIDEGVSLGFRRLSIIDLSGGGQPILNEDGTRVLVYNGEVYNYRELREDLLAKGHIFKTNTDSEVVLHGYEEYGPDFLKRLRGMYAFVIWDKTKRELFGARDIFGIKPLFYYQNGGDLLFASEIKAFLANPRFKKELNRERLPEYFCFEYIPSNETLFKNVYKIPAASWFLWKGGKIEMQPYFELQYNIDESKSREDWENIIAETFAGSTVAHGISDVEVGCFLSSGVDSSYVVHEMAKNNDVKTFSVGFVEEKYSELPYAEAFAETEGVKIFTKKISADEYFDIAPTVQYHMDEPLPNPSAIALYFLTKKAAEQVKVVLSGEGADELFGGYHYYKEPLDFAAYQRLPLFLRRGAAGFARKLPQGMHGRRFLINGAKTMDERYIRNNYVFDHTEREKLLNPNIQAPNPAAFTRPFFEQVKGEDDITKMQYVDMKTWLLDDILVKADRMSMANSLELRVPFLDKEMLRVALAMPSRHRVTQEETKVALRGAAGKQLPEKTAMMVKRGFPVPLNDWLRQEKYYNRVKEKFEGEAAREFFNIDYIMGLLNNHRDGKAKNMKKIWSVYSFILWYETFFING